MKISLLNLGKKDVAAYFALIKLIIDQEFGELNRLFNDILIIIGNSEDIKNGLYGKTERKYFGFVPIYLGKEVFNACCCAAPPKACIEVNLTRFRKLKVWKQKLSIRHECCHLLDLEPAITAEEEFREHHSSDMLKKFILILCEFRAHLCCINRYSEDWVRAMTIEILIGKIIPRIRYYKARKDAGKKAAFELAIHDMVLMQSVIYLYKNIPDNLKLRVKKRVKIVNRYMEDLYRALKEEHAGLYYPSKWLTSNDFISEDAFLKKVQLLLDLAKPR